MESRAKAFGHAIHPMLIVFPLGLLVTAVVFDILWLITHRAGFAVAAGYSIAGGVIGGLLAAVFGLVDWLAIPTGTRAKRIGMLHGLGNVVVVVLFAASWLLRSAADNGWRPGAVAKRRRCWKPLREGSVARPVRHRSRPHKPHTLCWRCSDRRCRWNSRSG